MYKKRPIVIATIIGAAAAAFVLLDDASRHQRSTAYRESANAIQPIKSIPEDAGPESTTSVGRIKRPRELLDRRKEIVFPNGEKVWVHLREYRPPDPPVPRKERFQFMYYELVESALSGNAASARVLYDGLTYCKDAFTDDDSLQEALRLLREEGIYTFPSGKEPRQVPTGLNSSPMETTMVRRYEFCEGISEDQKADALRWARKAADGGDFLGMRGLVRELGKTPETFQLWKAAWNKGHASAAQALSLYYRRGVPASTDGTIDYKRTYAYQLIMFKLDEAAYAHDARMLAEMDKVLRGLAANLSPREQSDAEALAADILRANGNCCMVQQ